MAIRRRNAGRGSRPNIIKVDIAEASVILLLLRPAKSTDMGHDNSGSFEMTLTDAGQHDAYAKGMQIREKLPRHVRKRPISTPFPSAIHTAQLLKGGLMNIRPENTSGTKINVIGESPSEMSPSTPIEIVGSKANVIQFPLIHPDSPIPEASIPAALMAAWAMTLIKSARRGTNAIQVGITTHDAIEALTHYLVPREVQQAHELEGHIPFKPLRGVRIELSRSGSKEYFADLSISGIRLGVEPERLMKLLVDAVASIPQMVEQ